MTKQIASAASALFAAALLIGGVSAPAMAKSDPEPQPKQTPQPTAKDPMKRQYCLVDVPTGSHIQKKQCKTRGDWIAETGQDPAKAN